ncbi:hypothetical protein KA089_01675 [Candidatus Woesebacteria bacterium]|nr:hypothetical protein [Candidatus Woesebacteria bacterium]
MKKINALTIGITLAVIVAISMLIINQIQLENIVSNQSNQLETLTTEKTDLQKQVDSMAYQKAIEETNNHKIFVVDEEGLSDRYAPLGKVVMYLKSTPFQTANGELLLNTKFEILQSPSLLNKETGKYTHLEIYEGQTAFLSTRLGEDGKTYLSYRVCYTNNISNCSSSATITDIEIK